jgi:hypothetical protein
MTTRILYIVPFILLAACGQPEKPEPKTEAPPVVTEDLHTPAMIQIGKVANPSFTSVNDFSELFETYLLDDQGNLNSATESATIDNYLKILDEDMDPITQAPVFEIKDTDNVVLLLKDKKAWALVLVDKGTMTLADIQFPKGSSIAKLGSNSEKFRQQLSGTSVTFSKNNFELIPWDEQIASKGDVVVDGISGATTICQSAVDLLNQQLPFYRSYFESN